MSYWSVNSYRNEQLLVVKSLMVSKIKLALLSMSCCLFSLSTYAIDKDTQVPMAEDLNHIGETLKKQGQGLVLFFYSDHCGYCTALDAEYLSPTIRSKEYKNKVAFARVQTDVDVTLIDFDGRKIAPSVLAQRYNARFSPSLVFVDGAGVMKAETIHGYTAPDLFPGYVDANIDKLLKAIAADKQ